jgi:hypothetical protein
MREASARAEGALYRWRLYAARTVELRLGGLEFAVDQPDGGDWVAAEPV